MSTCHILFENFSSDLLILFIIKKMSDVFIELFSRLKYMLIPSKSSIITKYITVDANVKYI